MRYKAIWYGFLYLTILLCLTAASGNQTELGISIQSPLPGEAVQGLVQIMGNTFIEGFISYELAFSFGIDSTLTWFQIEQSNNPVDYSVLGEWETSVLTDGNYILRLFVNRTDAPPIIIFVEGIRVRNYSPIETKTSTVQPPAFPAIPDESTPTNAAPTNKPLPQFTPTPLTNNPVEITTPQIYSSVQRGAIFALVVLGILGLYVASQRRQ
jgi:hypothetical protein